MELKRITAEHKVCRRHGRQTFLLVPGKMVRHRSTKMNTDKNLATQVSDWLGICVYRCSSVAICLFPAVIGGCSHAAPSPPARTVSTQPTREQRLSRAKDLFYRAVAGDDEALEQSQALLDELGGASSSNAQVVAYRGAVDLLAASRAFLLWDKASLAHQGLVLQDRAVAMARQDLEVRFLRGITNYQLPFLLGRRQLAIDDLAAVARDAEQAAREGRLDKRAAATDLDTYGNELDREGRIADAIAAWQAATRVGAGIPAGADAVKHLLSHGWNFPATLPNSSAPGSNSAR